MLEKEFRANVSLVDEYLRNYFSAGHMQEVPDRLKDSLLHSLFTGGKRFRPLISLFVAEELGVAKERTLPFAAALEMIHTYSLIHDDLPCMDDDDFRRGHPTNHRVFGEPMALLAGDALLTEAPLVLAKAFSDTPDIAVQLIQLLSLSAGASGMIAGQILDLWAQGLLSDKPKGDLTQADLQRLHSKKTGALIRAAAVGPGYVGRKPEKVIDLLSEYGSLLGHAFQVADDIHDYDPSHPELSGYPKYIGIDATRNLLAQTSQKATGVADQLVGRDSLLHALIRFNQERQH